MIWNVGPCFIAEQPESDIYIRDYCSEHEIDAGLARYFRFYNEERPHQSLGYRTPAAVHGVVQP